MQQRTNRFQHNLNKASMNFTRAVLVTVVVFVSLSAPRSSSVLADLSVASPFTDNAVLQRDMPVPVWGTADAAATVTVKFGGQQKSSVADKDGNWKLQLDSMPATLNRKRSRFLMELRRCLLLTFWLAKSGSVRGSRICSRGFRWPRI